MKKFNKVLAATIVLSTALTPTSFAAGTGSTGASNSVPTFSDLDKAAFWAKESIQQAKDRGLVTGYEDGTYRPLETVSREQIAAILARVLELEVPNASTSAFTDVSATHWSHNYIEAVNKAGVMVGDENGKFRPADLITREELAAVLVRAAEGNTQGKGSNLTVADKSLVSDWAKAYVETAIELGLLKGDGTNFNPKANALRQEIAVTAVRLAEALSKSVINTVADGTVTIDGSSYQVADSVKGILQAKNNEILSGAKLKFETSNNTVTKITFLEITKGGNPAVSGAAEFSGNLVLDGANGTVNGNVKVSANYVTIKNLTVTGELEITKELQNDFYSNNLKVSGKTIINGGDSNTVVFDNATLGNMEVNKQGVRVEPRGTTTVSEITVNSDANITADASVEIEKLTLEVGAANVEINAVVKTLVVADADVKITLTGNAKIENVTLPSDQKIEDVVTNYEEVKDKIENVNNTPVNPPVGGGGGGPVEDKLITGEKALKYVQPQDFGYWSEWEGYNVGFQLQLDNLSYDKITQIEVSLVDNANRPLATRTATGTQITKLQSDDQEYGGVDGQLSVAFIQRNEPATNDWWTSTPYDLTVPSKAIIKVTDKTGKVYVVEKSNPTGAPAPVIGADALNYLQPQDFGYWADIAPGIDGYNVGFQLQLDKLPYENIRKIEVSLVDAEQNHLATRTATGTQITKLQAEDEAYGEVDGQLSVAFIQRNQQQTNDWWTSTSYDLTVPAKVVIKVTDKTGKVYIVEKSNPTGAPAPVIGEDAHNYVQPQDFGYWSEWDGYNVGFQLQLDKLSYDNIRKIEVSLLDGKEQPLATRTATGTQITKLKTDDGEYGGLDGQLSVAFIQRDAQQSNDWWTSTPYDLTTPAKAVIKVTDKTGKVYIVENPNPTGASAKDPLNVVQPEDFGVFVNDAENLRGYSVGFNLSNGMQDVKQVEVSLFSQGELLSTNTSTEDLLKLPGTQFSSAFDVTGQFEDIYWTLGGKFDAAIVPDKAVIRVTKNDGTVYIVRNTNRTGDLELLDSSVAAVTNSSQLNQALNNPNISKIKLASGTYVGQFDIDRDVTLIGQGESTILRAPEELVVKATINGRNVSPILNITNAANVKLQDLVVEGAGKGKPSQGFVGIWVQNSGGQFTGIQVRNIRNGSTIDGMQEGIGIYAYNLDDTTRTLAVTNSKLFGYQKGGMVFKGSGLTVDVTGNSVTGAGSTDIIAQNGIQLSYGATGTISSNEITQHLYTGADWSAAGILLWEAGPGYIIENNKLEQNDRNRNDEVTVKTTDELTKALKDVNVKTITLAEGTFVGQFDVTRDVTLIGQGESTIIQAPESIRQNGTNSSIFKISNASNVVLEKLVIDGAGNGANGVNFTGISFENGGGEVKDVIVKDVRNGSAINGMQEGIGIYANNQDGVARKITVTGSKFSGYQKGGMVFKGKGLTVEVTNNTVTGEGTTPIIAQNGIQLSDGAVGTISGNTVTGHQCTTPGWDGSATGILVWGTYEGYTIENNNFGETDDDPDNGNDTNVLVDISKKLVAPTIFVEETGSIAGVEGTYKMYNYNPELVTVDAQNRITAVKSGVATIGVEVNKGNGIVEYGEVEVTIKDRIKTEAELESAIANAKPGDTIVLSDEIKLTKTLTINKKIVLNGNGKTLTATNAIGSGSITITADGAVVKNLGLVSNNRDGAIMISAPNVKVENNIVTFTATNPASAGIITVYGSNTAGGVIQGNTVTVNGAMGIYLNPSSDSGISKVADNTLTGNTATVGIVVDQTVTNYGMFTGNDIDDGFGTGFGFSIAPSRPAEEIVKALMETNTIKATEQVWFPSPSTTIE